MKLEDRLAENEQMMAALGAGAATAAPMYCACANTFCEDSVLVTLGEAHAAEQSGYRIVSLAHAENDGVEVMVRTARYAAVR